MENVLVLMLFGAVVIGIGLVAKRNHKPDSR